MALHLTNENFDAEVLQAKEPVLIDFYADWCTPCRMLAPVIDEIAQETPDLKVCKVNIEEEPDLARRFRILSIPTLIVMKEGEAAERLTGVRPKEDILRMLTE